MNKRLGFMLFSVLMPIGMLGMVPAASRVLLNRAGLPPIKVILQEKKGSGKNNKHVKKDMLLHKTVSNLETVKKHMAVTLKDVAPVIANGANPLPGVIDSKNVQEETIVKSSLVDPNMKVQQVVVDSSTTVVTSEVQKPVDPVVETSVKVQDVTTGLNSIQSLRDQAGKFTSASMEWVKARLNKMSDVMQPNVASVDSTVIAQPEAPVKVETNSDVSVAPAQTEVPVTENVQVADAATTSTVVSKAQEFITSPKALAGAVAGIVAAGTYAAYNYYVSNNNSVVVDTPIMDVANVIEVSKIETPKVEVSKIEIPKKTIFATLKEVQLSRKNIAIATAATALVGIATYALYNAFSKPSFDMLVQQYIYQTSEQNPEIIIGLFCQALEKYGYTSEEDKQKAMEVFIEAGLVQA